MVLEIAKINSVSVHSAAISISSRCYEINNKNIQYDLYLCQIHCFWSLSLMTDKFEFSQLQVPLDWPIFLVCWVISKKLKEITCHRLKGYIDILKGF